MLSYYSAIVKVLTASSDLMGVFIVSDLENQGVASFSLKAHVSSSILIRLRLESRDEHNAVERTLDLMSVKLTLEAYRRRLEQFYGFYGPLEAALQGRCDKGTEDAGESNLSGVTRSALTYRLTKTALLRQDLHHLGVMAADLPHCRQLPTLASQAEVLGCLYVLEGATLGGRLIAQHIQAKLGITPTTGGGFFEGYAGETGRMWQNMRQLLVSCAVDTKTENAIVANAIATFACLRGWCDLGNTSDQNYAEDQREVNQRA